MPRTAQHCDLGKLIDHRMVELGWVQADLSFVLGCSIAYVSAVVTGRKRLTAMSALKFAAATGIDAYQLLSTQNAELLRTVKPDPGIAARVAQVERLKRITPENLHGETFADAPVGNEFPNGYAD